MSRPGRPRLPIAEKIRRAVSDSGLTHLEIAKRADVAPSTVGRFMSGADPRLAQAERIAKAVGVEVDLVKGE